MPENLQQPLVLVVDHDCDVVQQVETTLTAIGYTCRCCATADEAMAAAGRQRPDLVIAESTLHGESGPRLCERIRQEPTLADVPVMFLSAAQIPDIIRRSYEGEGSYSLRKPFDAEVLVELVETALAKPQFVVRS